MLKKTLQGIVTALGIVLLIAILYLQSSPTPTTLPKPAQTTTNTAEEVPTTPTINSKEEIAATPLQLQQSIPKAPTTTYPPAMSNQAAIKELGIYVLVGLAIASIRLLNDPKQEPSENKIPVYNIALPVVIFLLSVISVWIIDARSKRKELFRKHQIDKLRQECEAIKPANFDNELERLQHQRNSLQIQHDELSYKLAINNESNENHTNKQDLQKLAQQIELLDTALEKQHKQQEAYTEIVQSIEEDIKQITQQRDSRWNMLLSLIAAEAIFYLILWQDSYHYSLYLTHSCHQSIKTPTDRPIKLTKLIAVLFLVLFALQTFIDYKKRITPPLKRNTENKPTLSKTMIILMDPTFYIRLFAFYRINLIALSLLHTLPAYIMNNYFSSFISTFKLKVYPYIEKLKLLGSLVAFLLPLTLQAIMHFSLTKRHLQTNAKIAKGYMAPYKDYEHNVKAKIHKALHPSPKHSTKNQPANQQQPADLDLSLLAMCALITMIIKLGAKVS